MMILMGKSGPKSSAPGGYGTITPKGYRRVWDVARKSYRMEQRLVWERHHGPVPEGYDVHHKDRDKLNNAIENLEMLSKVRHKREHGGCTQIDGEWMKPCRNCGEWHPETSYYVRKDGISPWCRPCCIKNAVENKRKRKAARIDTLVTRRYTPEP